MPRHVGKWPLCWTLSRRLQCGPKRTSLQPFPSKLRALELHRPASGADRRRSSDSMCWRPLGQAHVQQTSTWVHGAQSVRGGSKKWRECILSHEVQGQGGVPGRRSFPSSHPFGLGSRQVPLLRWTASKPRLSTTWRIRWMLLRISVVSLGSNLPCQPRGSKTWCVVW